MTLEVIFRILVCLSEMSLPLVVRLEKGLNLCEAISYEKSVGAASCVHQKCPFRYWYDLKINKDIKVSANVRYLRS